MHELSAGAIVPVVGYAVASSTGAVEELRLKMRSEIERLSS
jgi:hypothetical protein